MNNKQDYFTNEDKEYLIKILEYFSDGYTEILDDDSKDDLYDTDRGIWKGQSKLFLNYVKDWLDDLPTDESENESK